METRVQKALKTDRKLAEARNECGLQAAELADSFGIPDLYNVTTHVNEASPAESGAKTLKSGFEIKNQFKVQHEVKWPHGHIGPISHLRSVKPEYLDMDTFLYGYFMILNLDLPAAELKGRLQHGKQLLYHSILHGWESARLFHYKVLFAMELSNLEWSDEERMMLLSMSAAQEGQLLNQNSNSQASVLNAVPVTPVKKKERSITCYSYNYDPNGCKYEQNDGGCKKLHACMICAERGYYNRHTALKCDASK